MESLIQFIDNVEFVELENIMMVVNDDKKSVDFGLIDIEEWDIREQYCVNDILTTVLGTYFSDKFPPKSTVEEMVEKITNIFVTEEYDCRYLDIVKCEGLCSGEIRYNIKLPDGSVINMIECIDGIYMTCGHHLWYVLSLLRDSRDLSSWIECCKNIKYRHIGYYDLVQIEGVGHIPAPIALEKLGYEKILKIPMSDKIRDNRFYRCYNCGHESFYHLHPCDICGDGNEKYSSEEKDRILMDKNLICEYVCAQERYKYNIMRRTVNTVNTKTVQEQESEERRNIFSRLIKTNDNVLAVFHKKDYDVIVKDIKGKCLNADIDIMSLRHTLERLFETDIEDIDICSSVFVRIYDNGSVSLLAIHEENDKKVEEYIIDKGNESCYIELVYNVMYIYQSMSILEGLGHEYVTIRIYNGMPLSFIAGNTVITIAPRICSDKEEPELKTLKNIKILVIPYLPWIKEQIEKSSDKTIRMKVKNVADELGLIDEDEDDIYRELRHTLHKEGIIVDTGEHNSGEALLIMTTNCQEDSNENCT